MTDVIVAARKKIIGPQKLIYVVRKDNNQSVGGFDGLHVGARLFMKNYFNICGSEHHAL